MSSFHVDSRVTVKFDFDLATRLGDFILESGTADKQFLALGHKLQNLALEDENEEDDFPRSERVVSSCHLPGTESVEERMAAFIGSFAVS